LHTLSDHNDRLVRQGVVVGTEDLGLLSIMSTDVLRPAKSDGLIEQLHFNCKWPRSSSYIDAVSDSVHTIDEVAIR